MKAKEFKKGLKKIKNQLRGLTLQFCTKNSTRPYYTLREFGEAVLSQERRGYGFSIGQVWTANGIIEVSSFGSLAKLLKTQSVRAIQFRSYQQYDNISDYMRSFGSLD